MYKEIEDTAKRINKACPIQIDQTIRIDSCEAIPENILKYNYTFLFIDANSIDKMAFRSQIWDYIVYHIQNDEYVQTIKEKGATFIFSCKDEKENLIEELTIRPIDYRNLIEKPIGIDPKSLNEESLKKVLQEIVDQTQSQLPLFTEETGISMIDCRTYDKTLEYTCKLLNEDADRFDTIYFKTNGVPAAVESLKNNPGMKIFAENGVYINNVYLDKNAKYLCTITISPEEYL